MNTLPLQTGSLPYSRLTAFLRRRFAFCPSLIQTHIRHNGHVLAHSTHMHIGHGHVGIDMQFSPLSIAGQIKVKFMKLLSLHQRALGFGFKACQIMRTKQIVGGVVAGSDGIQEGLVESHNIIISNEL